MRYKLVHIWPRANMHVILTLRLVEIIARNLERHIAAVHTPTSINTSKPKLQTHHTQATVGSQATATLQTGTCPHAIHVACGGAYSYTSMHLV